jgi:hypothetical protein
VFFEQPPRRSLPRPSPRLLAVGLPALAAGAAVAVLLARDPPPQPPAPVARATAEQRLERQLAAGGVEQLRSVSCVGSIRPSRTTRCEVRFTDGDTQLMLVEVGADGELDIEVPYPAQRRPGG